MKIAIGCDHAGFGIKNAVKAHIESKGYEVVDVGTNSADSCHYPIFADAACKKILEGECELGILICGTGIGMSMAANKHKGIRAACCSDVFSARLTREHNDANMLCFGERVIGVELAKYLVDIWLQCDFAGGGSAPKVARINELEQEHIKNAK